MRRLLYTLALLLTSAYTLMSCAQGKQTNNKEADMNKQKILVAFFSRAGENYSVGNVKVGNTQIVAQLIADATKADTFQIRPAENYPTDYTECTEVAKEEHDTGARPAVIGDIKAEDYDVIFLGYPNWWGDAPMAVYTFIDKHDWNGKTVIPFCTHEGSGLSNEAEIKAACKGADVLKGFDIYGHTAQKNQAETKSKVQAWLKSNGF